MFKLIPEWRQWWRMHSQRAMLGAALLQGAALLENMRGAMPADLQPMLSLLDSLRPYLPPEVVSGVSIVLLVYGIVGRLLQQTGITPEASAPRQ